MKKTLKDVLSADAFVGYIENKKPDYGVSNVLEGLFPLSKIQGLEYSYIVTANGAVELTAPSAFDAEPIAQHRKGFDAMKGELPLWRRKMNISEKERQQLLTLLDGNNDEAIKGLLRQIFDDKMQLINGAKMTMEFLRSRVLMDGKIVIKSKGGSVKVDYQVPAANKYTLSGLDKWDNPALDIVSQIQGWQDKVQDATGIRPDKMYLNLKTFRLLRGNAQLIANAKPINAPAGYVITNDILAETLKALVGLTEIVIYDRIVQMDGKNLHLIEDNKVALVPSDRTLGNTLIGTSPAEFNAQYIADAGNDISITPEGIAVNMIVSNKAPYTAETQLEFIGLPSFLASNLVIQATVVS